MYNDFMYLTEKDLRFEIRQVNATINELATDQAGDITYLHQEIVELKSQIQTLTEQIEFLKDKSLFKDIAEEFLNFVQGSELIIHNAPFDIGFLNMELGRIGFPKVEDHIEKVTDSLVMARDLRPGQRNNLDALCRAYKVDNSKRSQHGALLDAQLLGEVYLGMTRGQEDIAINFSQDEKEVNLGVVDHNKLKVIRAKDNEILSHEAYLEKIQTKSLW